MAIPIQSSVEAAKIAQQTVQRPEAAPKAGASRFDQMMAQKADAAAATQQVQKVQATELLQALQKTGNVKTVQQSGKLDDLKLSNALRSAPVKGKEASAKSTSVIAQVFTKVEQRNASMGNFINDAISGKLKLNQSQLLGLQARVSEYSLELDLTGKVVEKTTTGLKDTLRTQV